MKWSSDWYISSSVPDPHPDPYIFGPPGSASGSVSHKYGSGSGSFHHQTKIVRKTLISTILWHFHDFLSLYNDVNVRVLRIRIHIRPHHCRYGTALQLDLQKKGPSTPCPKGRLVFLLMDPPSGDTSAGPSPRRRAPQRCQGDGLRPPHRPPPQPRHRI